MRYMHVNNQLKIICFKANRCRIGDRCFLSGAKGANECLICDPISNQEDWTQCRLIHHTLIIQQIVYNRELK